MSGCDDRYVLLRKRLDQLGYRQPLGLESLPLVEKLFGDMIATTESLRNSKNVLPVSIPTTVIHSDESGEYLKIENERLTRAHADLQRRHIKSNENCDKKLQEFRSNLRRLQNENEDLKFLNNQYMHKLKQMEKDNEDKLRQLIDYQERYSEAAVHTARSSKKGYCRQRMEIGYKLRDEWELVPRETEGVELMRMADKRIEQLSAENEEMRDKIEQLERENQYLDKQVKSRNAEIERLNQTMFDRPTGFGGSVANEQLIAQQNTQIDFLREQNKELELRVDQLISAGRMEADRFIGRTEWLEKRNEALEKKVGRSPQRRDASVSSRVDSQTINEQRMQVDELIKENKELGMSHHKNIQDLAREREENLKLSDMLQKCQKDKFELSNRLNQQISREHRLLGEINELRKESTSHVDDDFGRVRAERDQLRSMLENLELKVIKIQSHVSNLRREKEEYRRLAELKVERENIGPDIDLERLRNENAELAEEVSRLREKVDRVVSIAHNQGENDKFRAEFEEMNDKYFEADRRMKRLNVELEEERDNNEGLMAENERLNDQLATVREHCREEIEEKRCISKEREKLMDEVMSRERSVGELRTRLTAKEEEIKMLQEDLGVMRAKMEREWADNENLENSRAEITKTMEILDEENQRLSQQVDDKTEIIDQLEQSLQSKREELSKSKSSESQLGEEISRVRGIVVAREQEADSLRRQLEMSNSDNERYQVANQRNSCENERIVDELAALVAQYKQLQHVNDKLRGKIEFSEKELDDYKHQVDSAGESLYSKNEQIEVLKGDYSKLVQHFQEVSGEKTRLAEDIGKYRQMQVDYQRQIEAVLCENKQNLEVIKEREREIEGMVREVALMESKVHVLERDNSVMRTNLKNSSDLASKLSFGRDQLEDQLTYRKVSYNKMKEEMDEKMGELEEMRSRLQMEENKVSDVNEALQSSRDKIYRQDMTIGEKQSQIRSLEEKMGLLQCKNDNLTRELEICRGSCRDLSEDLQRMRKELTERRRGDTPMGGERG